MSSIKKNILANLTGRIWVAGISILLVPQYIKFLGIESYGLVGFYATLIASMTILDFGLSTTLNRELAHAKGVRKSAEDVKNLVFTMECIYWVIGLVIAVMIIVLAPSIAKYWINTEKISEDTVQQAIMLMGIVVAFQWPISLYNGGLLGLEKQVLNNVIMVIMTTLRSVGVLLVLWWISPTIHAFFIWQAIISLLYVFVIRMGLWQSLPKSRSNPRFSKKQISTIWQFASGMTGISIVAFILAQLDKVAVTKMVSLIQVGYYTLSITVANSITILAGPITATVFPRLTTLVSSKDTVGLLALYHSACKLLTALVFPVGIILVVFTPDILFLWTKDPIIVENTSVTVRILVVGSVCNSLMVIPYVLMLAHGKTLFVVLEASVACIILMFLLFQWIRTYGIMGASLGWLTTNFGRLVISSPLILKKFLPKREIINWYVKDIFLPLIPSLISGLLMKLAILYYFPGMHLNIITLSVVSFLILLISLLCLPMAKPYFKQLLSTK